MQNLFPIMSKVVESHMESYKDDFYKYDKEMLLEPRRTTKVYYWLVRNTGTELLHYPNFLAEGSWDNVSANYYANSSIVYKIEIDKIVGDEVYGDITRIPSKKFETYLKENQKKVDTATYIVYTNDGEKYKFDNEIDSNKSMTDFLLEKGIGPKEYTKCFYDYNFNGYVPKAL